MVMIKKTPTLVPPDGGWGWMVVFGVAITNTFNQSLLSVFGLLFGDILIDMDQGTVGAAWVGNIMLLVFNFTGVITGPALKTFSARTVTIAGSLLAGGGMIAASFSTRVWHLVLSYSVFTGLGIGLIQPSCFVAVNSYFRARRGRAVGISMAGTGLGQMLMPHLVRYLLDNFGFRGTALIVGGLAFNGIVGAMLFQPVKWHKIPERKKLTERTNLLDYQETSLSQNVPEVVTENSRLKPYIQKDSEQPAILLTSSVDRGAKTTRKPLMKSKSYNSITPKQPSDKIDQELPTTVTPKSVSVWKKIKRLLDLDLLLDPVFINIIFASGMVFTSNQNFNMLFPFFLQQEIGFDREQTAMCMSATAAMDIVGRLTIPIFTDKFKISSRITLLFGCITLVLSRQILCLQYKYIAIILASGLCGFFRSTIAVNQNLTVSEYCKEDEGKLPAALGLNMVTKGISIITFGQLLGWIRDYTGSYYICIYAQNFLLGLVVLFWTPELLYTYINDKNR